LSRSNLHAFAASKTLQRLEAEGADQVSRRLALKQGVEEAVGAALFSIELKNAKQALHIQLIQKPSKQPSSKFRKDAGGASQDTCLLHLQKETIFTSFISFAVDVALHNRIKLQAIYPMSVLMVIYILNERVIEDKTDGLGAEGCHTQLSPAMQVD
jgi:hypothetical protein